MGASPAFEAGAGSFQMLGSFFSSTRFRGGVLPASQSRIRSVNVRRFSAMALLRRETRKQEAVSGS